MEAKDAADTQVSSTTDPADKTAAGGEQDGEQGSEGDVFKKEDQTDAPTAPEKNQTHEEEEPKSGDGDVKEGEKGSAEEEEEEAPSSSEKKEEEPRSPETQKQDPTEDATLTDGKEEQSEVKYLFSFQSDISAVLCVRCVHVLQAEKLQRFPRRRQRAQPDEDHTSTSPWSAGRETPYQLHLTEEACRRSGGEYLETLRRRPPSANERRRSANRAKVQPSLFVSTVHSTPFHTTTLHSSCSAIYTVTCLFLLCAAFNDDDDDDEWFVSVFKATAVREPSKPC